MNDVDADDDDVNDVDADDENVDDVHDIDVDDDVDVGEMMQMNCVEE